MLTHRNILANIDAIGAGSPGRRAGRRHGRAAVLPLLWLHRHAVAAAGRRDSAWSIIPTRWTAKTHRRARAQAPRDDPDQHADLLPALRAQAASRSNSRACATPWSAPKSCASRLPRRSGRSSASTCSRATAAPRWRRWWRSTCPTSRTDGEHQRGTRAGNGRTSAARRRRKVVDPETGEGPLVGQEGLLLVKGPNRMLGYLTSPRTTADVAARRLVRHRRHRQRSTRTASSRITDRLSRFSKIGGEMVPHMRIEERIQSLIGDTCTASSPRCRTTRGVSGWSRSTPIPRWRRPNCGSGCAGASCRGCGCRVVKTCVSSKSCRRSAPARSICGAFGSLQSTAAAFVNLRRAGARGSFP